MYSKREKQIIFSISEVKQQNNLILHNGIVYTKRQWYAETSNFIITNNQVILKNNTISVPKAYLGKMYLLNIKKYSILGLFFPCAAFLMISLIVSYVHFYYQASPINAFFNENRTSLIFLDFLGLLFFLFCLGFLYKIFIKHTKIVYTKSGRNEGYKHLKNTTFLETKRILEQEDYIYFRPIETNRLTIRELEDKDLNDYYYFASSEIVHKYLSSTPHKSIEESERLIKNVRNQYQEHLIYKLGIIERISKKLIGYIGLSTYDLTITSCQVVYAIHEDFWGKGYVSEALSAFVSYLKKEGKTLIIAGHVKENLNSGKVLLKNGFKREESLDNQMIIHGELKNIISYAIGERKRKK